MLQNRNYLFPPLEGRLDFQNPHFEEKKTLIHVLLQNGIYQTGEMLIKWKGFLRFHKNCDTQMHSRCPQPTMLNNNCEVGDKDQLFA